MEDIFVQKVSIDVVKGKPCSIPHRERLALLLISLEVSPVQMMKSTSRTFKVSVVRAGYGNFH